MTLYTYKAIAISLPFTIGLSIRAIINNESLGTLPIFMLGGIIATYLWRKDNKIDKLKKKQWAEIKTLIKWFD